MFNRDGEPHFPFYRQFNPTRFKSFDEDLLTPVERVDEAILERLSTLLDTRALLSLPSLSDHVATWDHKVRNLALFCV